MIMSSVNTVSPYSITYLHPPPLFLGEKIRNGADDNQTTTFSIEINNAKNSHPQGPT